MNARFFRFCLFAASLGLAITARAQDLAVTPELLQTWLKQYPDADTDKNGILTEAEARVYYAKLLAAKSAAAAKKSPAPTLVDVHYGPAERNVFDFWRAPSTRPTAVLVYIHGGGFVVGDKTMVRDGRLIQQCLEAGVSLVSINYRFLSPTVPLQDILHDCARAIQYLRANAADFNLDKARVGAFGSSAGAGTSIWLACHPDMADPTNRDPVLRESTRLCCAAAFDCQFTYDMPQWEKVFGAEVKQRFGGIYNSPGLYGFKSNEEMMSPAGAKVRAECDFYAMISADDPPIYIRSGLPTTDLKNVNEYLHHPRHSELLYERLRAQGVPVIAKITALKINPPKEGPEHGEEFVFKYLQANPSPPSR